MTTTFRVKTTTKVILKGAPSTRESGFEDWRKERPLDDLIQTQEGIPFWATVPEAWEYAVLGPFRLPGYCEVTGHCKARNDRKSVAGKHGDTTTQKGQEAAEVNIVVHLFTPLQLVQMVGIMPNLRPKPGQGNSKPVRIIHPATEFLGVRYIVIDQVHLPERHGVDEYSIRIQAHEYFPPSVASKAKTQTQQLGQRTGPGALAPKPTAPGGTLHENAGPPTSRPVR